MDGEDGYQVAPLRRKFTRATPTGRRIGVRHVTLVYTDLRGLLFHDNASGFAIQIDSGTAGLQCRPVTWSGAVDRQRPPDGRPVVARPDQVLVDADLEGPGLLPIEAGGKQLGQRQEFGRRHRRGGRAGFGNNNGVQVRHTV